MKKIKKKHIKAANKAKKKDARRIKRDKKRAKKVRKLMEQNAALWNKVRTAKDPIVSDWGGRLFETYPTAGMLIYDVDALPDEWQRMLQDPNFDEKDAERIKKNIIRLMEINCSDLDLDLKKELVQKVIDALKHMSYEELGEMITDPVFRDHWFDDNYHGSYEDAKNDIEALVGIIETFKK